MSPGELVASLRGRHGLSQRSLAVRARTSQAWISRVERGEVSPSVESLERLLIALKQASGRDVDLRDIADLTDR